jgi:hypothetical protein
MSRLHSWFVFVAIAGLAGIGAALAGACKVAGGPCGPECQASNVCVAGKCVSRSEACPYASPCF